jgi:hypothetical protein
MPGARACPWADPSAGPGTGHDRKWYHLARSEIPAGRIRARPGLCVLRCLGLGYHGKSEAGSLSARALLLKAFVSLYPALLVRVEICVAMHQSVGCEPGTPTWSRSTADMPLQSSYVLTGVQLISVFQLVCRSRRRIGQPARPYRSPPGAAGRYGYFSLSRAQARAAPARRELARRPVFRPDGKARIRRPRQYFEHGFGRPHPAALCRPTAVPAQSERQPLQPGDRALAVRGPAPRRNIR